LKTTLQVVGIDEDKETASNILQQISGIPEEQINEFAIYGSPEDVLRQKESFCLCTVVIKF
jgi:hypothetical protein